MFFRRCIILRNSFTESVAENMGYLISSMGMDMFESIIINSCQTSYILLHILDLKYNNNVSLSSGTPFSRVLLLSMKPLDVSTSWFSVARGLLLKGPLLKRPEVHR